MKMVVHGPLSIQAFNSQNILQVTLCSLGGLGDKDCMNTYPQDLHANEIVYEEIIMKTAAGPVPSHLLLII